MGKWWRRIRGAIGMGLAWAAAWFGAGMVLLFIVGFGAADVPFPLGFGLLGFLAGVTFSGVLGIVERRRRFDQMSLPRFAVWGGVGGLLFSRIFVPVAGLSGGAFLGLGAIFALAGASCAAGSLALARAAERRELRGASEDVERVGLGGAVSVKRVGSGVFMPWDPRGKAADRAVGLAR
jgi:hypothetical protein